MPMDPEERELQIKLARFQVDIQLFLAESLGFFAVSAAFFIAAYQSTKSTYFPVFLFLALFWFAVANWLLRKVNSVRRKLGELK